MTVDEIKGMKDIKLKPNGYLKDEKKLRNYQKKALLIMLSRDRMILGDDVGLGKTLTSVAHFTYLKDQNKNVRALVLTERASLWQWQEEIMENTNGLKARVISAELYTNVNQRVRAFAQNEADVVITTYSQVYKYSYDIMRGLGDNVVLYADEPNYFKNDAAIIHKKISFLSKEVQRAYGLTATVVDNDLEEVLCILSGLAPGLIMNKQEFYRRFAIRRKLKNKGCVITVGYRNVGDFRKYIEPMYFGRVRDDPEVEAEIPIGVPLDVKVKMGKEQSNLVSQAVDRLIEMPGGEVEVSTVLTSLIRAQQLCNSPAVLGFGVKSEKEEVLVEMLKNSLLHKQVVIYSKYRTQIDRLEEVILKNVGEEPVRITGVQTAIERDEARRAFWDGKNRIMLITRAGQKSLNLQVGEVLIFYDLPWSYGLYRQAEGRVLRMGSKHSHVLVMRFLAELDPIFANPDVKTIDHYTMEVLMEKKKIFDAITGDETNILCKRSEIREIYAKMRGEEDKAILETLEKVGFEEE